MHRLGVCSWSLRPNDPRDLAREVAACGLSACQLALDPIRTGRWSERALVEALREGGVALLSGMVEMEGEDYGTLESIRRTGGLRPAATWPANLRAAHANAALARRLGLSLVTFHAGFLPEDSRDPERKVVLERLREIARVFADSGVATALETGQESAATLLGVLAELEPARVRVNFDAANMVLYGSGAPLAALQMLLPHVAQVHVKDALPARTPGTWGTEVPVGTGAVPWHELLALLRAQRPDAALVIEREAGDARVADVRTARALLEQADPGSVLR